MAGDDGKEERTLTILAQRKSYAVATFFSGTVTGAGNSQSTPVDASEYVGAEIFINITAISGTSPTFSAWLQTQDPAGNWVDLVQIANALSATGETVVSVGRGLPTNAELGKSLAVRWALGGTNPSVTVTISGVLKS
jgi:hypothetical protein